MFEPCGCNADSCYALPHRNIGPQIDAVFVFGRTYALTSIVWAGINHPKQYFRLKVNFVEIE